MAQSAVDLFEQSLIDDQHAMAIQCAAPELSAKEPVCIASSTNLCI
jgi:hypothetical protein